MCLFSISRYSLRDGPLKSNLTSELLTQKTESASKNKYSMS